MKNQFGHRHNRTDLHQAVEKDDVEKVKFLISNGASLEARDEFGFTPFILASCNGSAKSIKVLRESGANMLARDNNGWTGFDQARHNEKLYNRDYSAAFKEMQFNKDTQQLSNTPPSSWLSLSLFNNWSFFGTQNNQTGDNNQLSSVNKSSNVFRK